MKQNTESLPAGSKVKAVPSNKSGLSTQYKTAQKTKDIESKLLDKELELNNQLETLVDEVEKHYRDGADANDWIVRQGYTAKFNGLSWHKHKVVLAQLALDELDEDVPDFVEDDDK